MTMKRRAVAPSFRSFGRRRPALTMDDLRAQDGGPRDVAGGAAVTGRSNHYSDDVRLFAITFAGGFLFMTVFLG